MVDSPCIEAATPCMSQMYDQYLYAGAFVLNDTKMTLIWLRSSSRSLSSKITKWSNCNRDYFSSCDRPDGDRSSGWRIKNFDPVTLIKKIVRNSKCKIAISYFFNSYFRWTFQNRKRTMSHKIWNTNIILVRNQSNGFVKHSSKFWWSIFWTITWNVWPSDISVGASWILCIQGNVPSIFKIL